MLHIGTTTTGERLELPLDALTTMITIVGRRGSGKTTTAMVLAEEYVDANLPVVLLDPLGVHWGLRSSADGERPGLPVTILGGAHGDVALEEKAGGFIADLVVEQPGAYIVDFSGFESRSAEKRFATDFAERLYRRKAHETSALGLIVDEADTFAPQNGGADEKRMLGAFEAIARRGRVRGLGMVAITQRPAVLNKNVSTQSELIIAHQLTSPQDREALKAWVTGNSTPEQLETFLASLASLKVGEAWVWSPAWLEIFERVQVRPRRTFDSSRTPKAGETRVEPRVLAPVDLEALRDRMADAIEQADANDPKQLRERIKDLEAELFAKCSVCGEATALVTPGAVVGPSIMHGSRCFYCGEDFCFKHSKEHYDSEVHTVPACNHEPVIAELKQDLADSQAYVKQLTKERDHLHGRVLLLHGSIAYIETQAKTALAELEDSNGQTPPTGGLRRDGGNEQASRGDRGTVEDGAGEGTRADRRRDRPTGEGVARLPAGPRPGGLRGGSSGARGVGHPSGPAVSQRRLEDMTEDEAREFIRSEVARQLKDSDRVLYVPAAEVIRKDYLQQAVARALEKASQVGPDGREVIRFMLAHFDDPMVVSMPLSRIATGVSDYREGRIPDRWGNTMRALASAGLVEVGGRGGSTAYRPRVREWVQSELNAHDATLEEIEATYQAVIAELAGEVVAA